MKKLITLLLLSLFVVGIVSCGNTVKEPIKIGFIGPLTGPVANPGVYVKNSFELAQTQLSTVNGREIQVFYEDGKCIPKEGVTAAKKLLEVNEVNVIVSAVCGGSMLAIAPLMQDKILISPIVSTPAISEAGDYVFRISSSADLFAKKTALKIRELGFTKIGLVVENTEYAVGWKDSFVKSFTSEITAIETFSPGDTDVKTQLMKVDETKPDAILFLVQSPLSAALLVQQAKELGIKTQLVGNEAFFARQVVKALMKDDAEGLLVLTYKYDLNSTKMQKFMADYELAYGEKIPEEIYGALGYDLYTILYDAFADCKKADSDCVRDFLYQTSREGASGFFTIDEKGDGIRDFMWWKVENSTLVPLE